MHYPNALIRTHHLLMKLAGKQKMSLFWRYSSSTFVLAFFDRYTANIHIDAFFFDWKRVKAQGTGK
jgi:hypothetical protein